MAKELIQPHTRGTNARAPGADPIRGLSRDGPARILTVNSSDGRSSSTFNRSRLNNANKFNTSELSPKNQITVFRLIELLNRSSGRSSRGPAHVRNAMFTDLASSGEAPETTDSRLCRMNWPKAC